MNNNVDYDYKESLSNFINKKKEKKTIFEMLDYTNDNVEQIYEDKKLENNITNKHESDSSHRMFVNVTKKQLLESVLHDFAPKTKEYNAILNELITNFCESNSLDPDDNEDRIKAFNNINLPENKKKLKSPSDGDESIIFTADKWIKKTNLRDNIINYNLADIRYKDPSRVMYSFGQLDIKKGPKSPSDTGNYKTTIRSKNNTLTETDDNNTLEIIIDNPKDKEDIIKQIYKSLHIEDVIDWDALLDNLQRLSNIKFTNIVISNRNMDNISKEDINTYVSILRNAVKYWQTQKEHNIIINFNNNTDAFDYAYAQLDI